MIYLDNAATTPLDPEVLETMIEFMRTEYGNPSSKYYPQAISAQNALKKARQQVADLLNTDPEYILFTSGATESNNFIIKGVAEQYAHRGRHILTSKIEHKSVLETCKYLEKHGLEVTYLDVDPLGHVLIDQLKESIREDTILVSIMWGNNEIGTLNDVETIGNICREKNVLFHTDATQVVGKIEVDLSKLKIDFLSMSAHKIYGPKGIGAAYLGPDDLGLRRKLPPLHHGGDQEFKMRSGTHSMHNIVGFGKACSIATIEHSKIVSAISTIEHNFINSMLNMKFDVIVNGDLKNKIPGLLSITVPGINSELFCKNISTSVSISTGSACTSSVGSSVLSAINQNLQSTFRISISKYTRHSELLQLLDLISQQFHP